MVVHLGVTHNRILRNAGPQVVPIASFEGLQPSCEASSTLTQLSSTLASLARIPVPEHQGDVRYSTIVAWPQASVVKHSFVEGLVSKPPVWLQDLGCVETECRGHVAGLIR